MYLVGVSRVRLLLVLVAVLGDGDEEAVDAQLAVQLQRLLHRFLLVERYSYCQQTVQALQKSPHPAKIFRLRGRHLYCTSVCGNT